MQFARSSFSQPYWVYHPGIAFDGVIRRGRPPRNSAAGGDADLSAGIARSPEELHAAASLVESRYAARGYVLAPDEGASRPGPTLIAAERERIVGTLKLGFDGPRRLAADESYGDAVDAVRRTGRDVCELTRLALSASVNSRSVLSALFQAAYVVGRRLHGVTDVFVEVNPRHAQFYRKLFGFVVAAGERVCPRVMAPAVLLRLEIARLEARLVEIGAGDRPLPERSVAIA